MRTSSYIITSVKADANPPPPKLVVVFPINIGVSIDLTGDSIYNIFIFYLFHGLQHSTGAKGAVKLAGLVIYWRK
jgi:hypothetical protein